MRSVICLSLCVALCFVPACGDDESPTAPDETTLLSYINGISPYPDPPAEFSKQVGDPSETEVDNGVNGVLVCNETKYEMGRNPHEIVAFDPNAGAMWPGCIVQGDPVEDGLLVPVSAKRTPCTVGIPGLPAANRSATVDEPGQYSVPDALDDIVRSFLADEGDIGAEFAFTMKETYGFEQGMLDIGISANWPGGDLRSQFGYEWESEKRTMLLKFTQKYYTATVDPPSSPVAYFDESVKAADIKNYTSNGNPLCYVNSVTYGRLGILSMTSEESSSQMRLALDLAFSDVKGGGEIDSESWYGELIQQSETKLLIIGGDATQGVVDLGDPVGQLMNWINDGMSLTDVTQAKPISYTVAHLKDNTKTRFQYTTEFTQRDCAWADQPVWVSVYRLRCTEPETTGGLEGWCDVWLTETIPGLPDPIEHHETARFTSLNDNETFDMTSATWDFNLPKQPGAKFVLRIKILEEDNPGFPLYDDHDLLGDLKWEFEYPNFAAGGTCDDDAERCSFDQEFAGNGQAIHAYFKVHLDGQP